jgi:hypothetical protein
MGLSPEAIIGLVTLFVTCPPSALLVYSWICRRKRNTRSIGLTLQVLINTARCLCIPIGTLQSSQIQPRQRGTSTLDHVIIGTDSQESEAILWNYSLSLIQRLSEAHDESSADICQPFAEVVSFSLESRCHIFKRAHTAEYNPTYERHPMDRNTTWC